MIGMLILNSRRFTLKRVRELSAVSDMIVNTLLLFIVFIEMYSVIGTSITQPEFDYRDSISIWFRFLLIFRPDASFYVKCSIELFREKLYSV